MLAMDEDQRQVHAMTRELRDMLTDACPRCEQAFIDFSNTHTRTHKHTNTNEHTNTQTQKYKRKRKLKLKHNHRRVLCSLVQPLPLQLLRLVPAGLRGRCTPTRGQHPTIPYPNLPPPHLTQRSTTLPYHPFTTPNPEFITLHHPTNHPTHFHRLAAPTI